MLDITSDNVPRFITKKWVEVHDAIKSGKKEVEITVPLKYLSNFWRTLKMSLINCEVSLILT